MKKSCLLIIISSIYFSCKKTEPAPTPSTPVVTNPTVPTACPVVSISDINKKTSHYKKYNVSFFDYYLTTNSDYNKLYGQIYTNMLGLKLDESHGFIQTFGHLFGTTPS